MKAVIQGVDVEGTPAELAEFIQALKDDGTIISSAEPAKAEPVLVQRKMSPAVLNRSSRYYLAERQRHSTIMAEVYEYVAGYKNGRTSRQVAEHFNAPISTAQSRLNTLKNEGLIVAPVHAGGNWVITNTPLAGEQHHPSPVDMPRKIRRVQ